MSSPFIFEKLGIALLLGFLVGLQRQKARSRLAGFRTFPLITLLGTLSALLAQSFGGAILVGGIFGIIALIVVGNLSSVRNDEPPTGITTEVSMLVMFAVGAYLVVGPAIVSVAIGGGVAVLLQFKPELHGFASRLGDADITAIMRFVLLSFIILPVLPNEAFGPFEVLNPHEIWLMVIVIVGLNLTGHILYKFVGDTVGTVSSGILGGLVSSTATTMSFARLSRTEGNSVTRAATVIFIASTFVYIRVLAEMAALSPTLFNVSLAPIGLVFSVSLVLCVVSFLSGRSSRHRIPTPKRPGDVRSALLFGVTYALVVLAIAAAKKYLGTGSLFWVAGISGLTDVDAITLSTARLVTSGQLDPIHGQEMVLIAVLSNLLFKTAIVAMSGSRWLLWRVGGFTGFCLITGIAALLIW